MKPAYNGYPIKRTTFNSRHFFGDRLNYSQTLISKPLCSGHHEYGMRDLTWKNLYIVKRAEKKINETKLDFHKTLYFRDLETIRSCSFSTFFRLFFDSVTSLYVISNVETLKLALCKQTNISRYPVK